MPRAIIMAGGEGARLRPYTTVIPKPLMPIGDRPVLDIVHAPAARGTASTHVTIATGYLAELIEAFFRDGDGLDMRIDYFREDEPLGTVGALAADRRPGRALPGHERRRPDGHGLRGAAGAPPRESGAAVTVAVTRRTVKISLGVMRFEDGADPQRITRYVEKPTLDYEASMGVYCFSPRGARATSSRTCGSTSPSLILRLLDAGEASRRGSPDAYWLDIGRHDDYEQAIDEFEAMRDRLLPDG